MSLPASYAIFSGLLESFVKSSTQDILKSEAKKLEREERELLVILEVDSVSLVYDSSDDEIYPSTYQYISMLHIYAPHMMIRRQLSQIMTRRVGEVIDDSGPSEPEEEEEPKAKKEV